jgi:GDPmannose 4,6-dehydratase
MMQSIRHSGRRFNTSRTDPRYFRPAEVGTLFRDPTKANEKHGWTPITTLE